MKFEEIESGIKELTEKPIKPIPEETIAKIKKKLIEKCPKSQELFEEMKNCVPGGYEHQLLINDPFTLTVKSALGSKIWDVDDNEYTDFLNGAGAVILGHNYPPLRDAVIEVMQNIDSACYFTNEYELKAIKEIKKHVPSIKLFKFFQSGTEADMCAIRLARAFTKKKRIVKIGGGYHGWSDQLTFDMHVPFSGDMESNGIPRHCYRNTIAVPPNDLEAMEEVFKKEKKKGIAGVILEPLGPESGNIPVSPDFNKGVEELCRKYDSLLIFDEVVTGFRMGLGGAQAYFGVEPDLTTFGKILTHGHPSAGGVGGREDVMSLLAAGIEPGDKVMATGTMLGNPISTAACYHTLKILEKENVPEKAEKTAVKLVKKLNDLFESHGVPYFSYNFRSVFQYKTYAPINMDIRIPGNIQKALYRNECVNNIALAMLSQGVVTKRGASGFASLAHTDEDVEKFIQAFDNVLKMIPH
ncbi:MAG: aminotransferase class III-fold pyridoxal phosphate-dependent enzyme [Promethearchaeota archaeon]|nr:MAG: aminotransferase class III-fold pyridoxal phosphate-dependent enzyme [Candidatus Lokiarchaeota archaeon]